MTGREVVQAVKKAKWEAMRRIKPTGVLLGEAEWEAMSNYEDVFGCPQILGPKLTIIGLKVVWTWEASEVRVFEDRPYAWVF